MPYQVMGRRTGTPQAEWRVIRGATFQSRVEADAEVDTRTLAEATAARPWEFHVVQVPE